MGNTGKSYEKDFELRIKALGKRAYLHRFDDAAAIRGKTGVAGYAKKQPSDYLLVLDGTTHFTEVKSCESATSFSFSQLEEGQHAAAKQITAARGSYMVIVFSIVLNEWFEISYREILNISITKKSIKWTEMRPFRV